MDLFISGGTVVTMDAQRRVIEDGAVAIQGDSIVAVSKRTDLESQSNEARTIDASGTLVLPGLINGHAHAAMSLFRGIAEDHSLDDWLQRYIFPAEARNVTEDFVLWGTRLGLLEMVRGGVTTFADMYYFEDVVARVTKEAGMRGILGETILDFPAPDNKTCRRRPRVHRDLYPPLEKRSAYHAGRCAPFDLHALGRQSARSGRGGAARRRADSDPHRGSSF